MRYVLLGVLVIVGLSSLSIYGMKAVIDSNLTEEAERVIEAQKKVPESKPLEVSLSLSNAQGHQKIIILEDRNTISLRGPVTEISVSKLMKEFQTKSKILPKDAPIYFVLKTPGGSV